MSQVGSITWRIILSLAFIIILNTGYCSQSTVNKTENGLKHTIATKGLHGNTRTQISVPLKLQQRPYPVETYSVEKWNTESMLELHNKTKRDDTYRKPQVERNRHSDVNKIHVPIIHEHDWTDVITDLANVSKRSARRDSPSQKCQRLHMYINFRSINWAWVHSPKGYDAFVCGGDCGYPLVDSNIPLHAKIQASIHATNRKTFNNPCCVPTKLSSLSVEYYYGRAKISLTLPNMIVDECGCR